MITDNAPFGQWDMDMLANEWDGLPLTEWGVDEFYPIDGSDEEKLTQTEEELRPYKKVHILISIDVDSADRIIDLLDELRKMEGVEIEQAAN
jgi:hypothetical protein